MARSDGVVEPNEKRGIMKKTVCILIAVVMIFSLAACSRSGSDNDIPVQVPRVRENAQNTPAATTPPLAPSPSETSVMRDLPENMAWWDGDWYGYWEIVSADDPYKQFMGQIWDCYAIIHANHDMTALIILFDDDMEMGEIHVDIIEGYGAGLMGMAEATKGQMFGEPIRDDIFLNPNSAPHDNMIVIDEWFEDSDGDEFRYKIFLRPWGMSWGDIPTNERPPYYELWYLDVMNMTMEEAIASIGSGAGSGSGGGTSSSPANVDGLVGSEIKSQDGKTGMMYAQLPDGWYDHSIPEFGFIKFSESDDPFDSGALSVEFSSRDKVYDDLIDHIWRDGTPLSFTYDDREWVGVEERDGFGYAQVVTDVGGGKIVEATFEGLTGIDDLTKTILRSFVVVWD